MLAKKKQKSQTIDIEYSNGSGIFYSSEELSGYLILNLNQPVRIKKISLRIKGKGVVKWKENAALSSKEDSQPEDLWRTSTEIYLDTNHDLFNEGGHSIALESGQHRFQFKYLLPSNLPTTFSSCSGRVYYSCEALLHTDPRPSVFSTRKFKKSFAVLTKLELSSIPFANTKVTHQLCKTLYSCCWSMGFLKATLVVDKGAYVPGEKIVLNVEISNQSAIYLSHLEARLKRVVICRTDKDSILDENVVISGAHCLKSVAPYENFMWKNAQIFIPPHNPPTDLGGGCQIISVTYNLKVDIRTHHTACISSGLTFKIPIIMGTTSEMDLFGATGGQRVVEQLPSIPAPIIIDSQPVRAATKDFHMKWHNDKSNHDEVSLIAAQ